MRFIGIDLHTNSFTACYLENNSAHERIQTLNLQKDLDQFIAGLEKTDEVALEATVNSTFFRDKVAPHLKRVVVIAPGEFDVIRKSVKKRTNMTRELLPFF